MVLVGGATAVNRVKDVQLSFANPGTKVAVGSDKYIGGVPVVLFGDFGQLAPIDKRSDQIDWLWYSAVTYRVAY